MAIYRTGTASLNAQGVIVGVGTNWQDKLSLVRVGATMIFQTAPLTICTISSIVSPTEMRATATDGAVVAAGTKYVILLHDSITVDGLAQDVAETLRYYQSKETVIEDAIEFFQNFDWERIVAVGNQAKADAQTASTAATNAKTSETNSKASENAAKASQTAAAASQAAAKTSETNAKASETAAKTSQTAAAGSATAAASSASAAAGSATAAKTSETNAKTSETNANSSKVAAASSQTAAAGSASAASGSATAAKTSETNAKTSETNAASSKTAAAASATTATQQADRAKTEADRAASANPDNQLKKANNLSDVANVETSRQNLDVYSKTETNAQIDGLMTQKGLNSTGFIPGSDANGIQYNGFFAGSGADGVNFDLPYAPGIVMRRVNSVFQAQLDGEGRWRARALEGGTWSAWARSVIKGDFGIGLIGQGLPTDFSSSFIGDSNGSTTWAPTNGAGFQASYANQRCAQVWVDNTGRLHSRFNMTASAQATKAASQWRRALNDVDDAPGFERFGGGANGSLNNIRGSSHGNYYQVMTAGATTDNGYPNNGIACSITVLQNGANGADGCTQEYMPYTGTGGKQFRFLAPNGSVLVPGGTNGWKSYLTNNGDICGGGSPTITDWNNFSKDHIGFGYGGGTTNGPGINGIVQTWSNTRFEQYKSMTSHDYTSGRMFCRTFNADSVKTWTAWREVTFAAVSDERLKEVKGNMNVDSALDNICRMEFKLFRYLDDAPDKSARRGVIAQQVRMIDREYTKEVGGFYHLDSTPMLLDGLAAIKALRARDVENKERISKLENDVEELKALVAALVAK